MLPSFLGRDLLVQYPTTVVAVVFLILVWRNTHDLLKIAVEGGNILISDPQSNLCHGADMGFLFRIAAGDQEQQRCHKILFHGFMILMLRLSFV